MPDPNQAEPNKGRYGATHADARVPTPAARTPAIAADRYGQTTADVSATPVLSGLGGAAHPFRIVTLIGEGGMGRVYLAHDSSLDRLVALKRMTAEHVANERLRQRFLTEARSSSRLNHFHIVQVYRLGEDAEGPFIAMEFVPGPLPARHADWPADMANPPLDLDALIKLQGPLGITAVVQLGRQLLSAVGYAHRGDVIHRDIKPANILLTAQFEAKLADFGLARHLDATTDEGRTLAGAQLLTLGYGAPEQEIDASRADHRADLYAVAATMWYALTGHNPRYFRESDVPLPLRATLVRALERDREKRFQNAAEFDGALAQLTSQPSVPVATAAAVPVAAAAPVPVAAAVSRTPGLGKCPKCAHVHPAAALAALKYCEQCGNALMEPCLNCTQMNGIWIKFCGSCGVDVASHGEKVIRAKTAELQQARSVAEDGDYGQAREILLRLSVLTHPRLTVLAAQASAQMEETRIAQMAAERDRDDKVQRAEQFLAKRQLEEADAVLARVPAPLYNAALLRAQQEVRYLLGEKAKLKQEIAKQLRDRQYRGLTAKVERMVVLDPRDRYYIDLVDVARDKEQNALEEAWSAARRANTSAAYTEFLDAYPEDQHVEQAQQLLMLATRYEVMAQPGRAPLRRHYLALRDRALRRQDMARAALGVIFLFTVLGGISGALSGGTYNVVSSARANVGQPMTPTLPPNVRFDPAFHPIPNPPPPPILKTPASTSNLPWGMLICGAIGGAAIAVTRSAGLQGPGCLIAAVLFVAVAWFALWIGMTRPGVAPTPWRPLFATGAWIGLVPGVLTGGVFGLLVGAPWCKAVQFGPLPWYRYATPIPALQRRFLPR